jgi:hypothetical protein
MTTKEVNKAIEDQCTDFIGICPHCNTKAHLEMVHDDFHLTRNGDQYNYITFRCKPCKKLSIRIFHSEENPYSTDSQLLTPKGWVNEYPAANTVPSEVFVESAPEDVIADYAEGLICLANGADKAAVSMFRRAIQNAMLNLGADAKIDLINQIKGVSSLTKDIQDWAQNIRIFGNWGAHPQDDNLKEIDHELALEVKDFVDQFINYVYVMPSRVASARSKHAKKTGPDDEE